MRIARKFTSAHAIALVALFVALGGTVYAASAINGRSIKKGSIPGNRLRADSLTGAQIEEGSLGTVPSARTATQAESAKQANSATQANSAKQADTAKQAESAKHASEADNALALAGVPASGYQRSCQNGALKGSVVVDTTLTTVNEFVEFKGYNCGNSTIEVLHAAGPGEYFVKFNNGPGGINPPVPAAVSVATGPNGAFAKVRSINDPNDGGQPSFLVQVFNTAGAGVDGSTFTLLAF